MYKPLNILVREALDRYLTAMEDEQITDLYNLVLGEMELPLLESILQKARGNQLMAAKWLGISRGTLRKMIDKYALSSKNFKQPSPCDFAPSSE